MNSFRMRILNMHTKSIISTWNTVSQKLFLHVFGSLVEISSSNCQPFQCLCWRITHSFYWYWNAQMPKNLLPTSFRSFELHRKWQAFADEITNQQKTKSNQFRLYFLDTSNAIEYSMKKFLSISKSIHNQKLCRYSYKKRYLITNSHRIFSIRAIATRDVDFMLFDFSNGIWKFCFVSLTFDQSILRLLNRLGCFFFARSIWRFLFRETPFRSH